MATVKKGAKKKPEKKPASSAKKKAAADAKLISSKELAGVLGVELTKRLDTPAVRKLRKALPGYVNLLDDAAELLKEDAALLNLRDVRPEDLIELQNRHKYLSGREAVAETVYRSIYEQRLQVDDEAMGKLLKIARRIESSAEDDPDVRIRWKSVVDFLAKFRPGPSGAAPEAPPEGGG